jgi:hypothetical protein
MLANLCPGVTRMAGSYESSSVAPLGWFTRPALSGVDTLLAIKRFSGVAR